MPRFAHDTIFHARWAPLLPQLNPSTNMSLSLVPVLTPHGALRLDPGEDEFVLEAGSPSGVRGASRGRGPWPAAARRGQAGSALPPALAWWRDFASRCVAELCAMGEAQCGRGRRTRPRRPRANSRALIEEAPPMPGGEYLRPDVLAALWREMAQALEVELAESERLPRRLPEQPRQPLASGRSRAFQSRGKSPRRGVSVRLHGDLHVRPRRARRAAAPAARRRRCANMPARRQGRAAAAARAGAAAPARPARG